MKKKWKNIATNQTNRTQQQQTIVNTNWHNFRFFSRCYISEKYINTSEKKAIRTQLLIA